MRQNRLAIFALTAFFSFMAFHQAAAEKTITLHPSADGKGAIGKMVIQNLNQNEKEVSIHTEGLKPGAVYTVWLINMKPSIFPFVKPKMEMAGLGQGDYSFKTDDSGNGAYRATISGKDLGNWQLVKIAHHPDGNPKNMKSIISPLQADLR
ncbi:hypothetical protein JYT92_00280 [bacterium AH-315-L15]|nr:hypothetical protein [bacterium AH-315-L15]